MRTIIATKSLKIIAGLLLLISMASTYAEPIVESTRVAFFVGQQVMVCGTVTEVKTFSKGTYLNMGARYPNQHLGILIWNSDEDLFKNRFGGLAAFEGRHACVRGRIEVYKDKLQLKVANPQFLRLMK